MAVNLNAHARPAAPQAPVIALRPAPFHSRPLAEGETLFAPGDAATETFLIVEGFVMIAKTLPDGRRQIVDVARAGRIIGFARSLRHDCHAVALRACVVVARPASANDLRAMGAEIERLRDLALLLGRKTAIERLATFLLEMAGDDAAITLPMSRQDIADYLGLVIETVCRNFVALKKRGIIATSGRERVAILDRQALQRVAAGHGDAPVVTLRQNTFAADLRRKSSAALATASTPLHGNVTEP